MDSGINERRESPLRSASKSLSISIDMNHYPIEIQGIFIAPAHQVFGVSRGDVSGQDLVELSEAKLIEDAGIEGDRFCRPRPDYNGHVTFFSKEVWDEIAGEFDLSEGMGPEVLRRNIIVSGIDLKALYGAPFSISDIEFLGTVHCAPCIAMNSALGEGARKALRSRGGLRAQVKTSGVLKPGPCQLATRVRIKAGNAAEQEPELDLP